MKKAIFLLFIICPVIFGGWFFVPGAYWTFQDGGVGFFYAQGEYEKLGWTFDGRYSFSNDLWLDTELNSKVIGERTALRFNFSQDSIQNDWRKPTGDTTTIGPYDAMEYSAYIRQRFKAGKSSRVELFAGYNRGEYKSNYSYDMAGSWDSEPETRIADAVDAGFEFSFDSREDPENPQTAYYFGVRLGGLYFPSAGEENFDFLDLVQFTDSENNWPPDGSGYIELDQRFFGKLQMDKVPFPVILALRIGLGHHLTEVPQLVAFKAGKDDFLRGVDKRHLMGTSYYIMSGELRAQIWEESYTPLVLLHWLIPGYPNPRPTLEIVPIVEAARIYGEYVRDEEQQMTYGLGLHWVFSDYTVIRFDVCYWGKGETWGAYFSFEPSI